MKEFDQESFDNIKALFKDDMLVATDEFLEDARTYISKIEDGIKTSDFQKISQGSHPLKSNSRGFGLCAVGKYSEDIHYLAEHGGKNSEDLGQISHLFAELKSLLKRGEVKLKSLVY